MDIPVAPQKGPKAVELVANKKYFYCTCGLSEKLPFCDSAHTETDMRPIMFDVEQSKTFYICTCRNSKKVPFCDGSHNAI